MALTFVSESSAIRHFTHTSASVNLSPAGAALLYHSMSMLNFRPRASLVMKLSISPQDFPHKSQTFFSMIHLWLWNSPRNARSIRANCSSVHASTCDFTASSVSASNSHSHSVSS